jgi:hypothetical protein
MSEHLNTKDIYEILTTYRTALSNAIRDRNYLMYIRQLDFGMYEECDKYIQYLEAQVAKYEQMLYDPKIKK